MAAAAPRTPRGAGAAGGVGPRGDCQSHPPPPPPAPAGPAPAVRAPPTVGPALGRGTHPVAPFVGRLLPPAVPVQPPLLPPASRSVCRLQPCGGGRRAGQARPARALPAQFGATSRRRVPFCSHPPTPASFTGHLFCPIPWPHYPNTALASAPTPTLTTSAHFAPGRGGPLAAAAAAAAPFPPHPPPPGMAAPPSTSLPPFSLNTWGPPAVASSAPAGCLAPPPRAREVVLHRRRRRGGGSLQAGVVSPHLLAAALAALSGVAEVDGGDRRCLADGGRGFTPDKGVGRLRGGKGRRDEGGDATCRGHEGCLLPGTKGLWVKVQAEGALEEAAGGGVGSTGVDCHADATAVTDASTFRDLKETATVAASAGRAAETTTAPRPPCGSAAVRATSANGGAMAALSEGPSSATTAVHAARKVSAGSVPVGIVPSYCQDAPAVSLTSPASVSPVEAALLPVATSSPPQLMSTRRVSVASDAMDRVAARNIAPSSALAATPAPVSINSAGISSRGGSPRRDNPLPAGTSAKGPALSSGSRSFPPIARPDVADQSVDTPPKFGAGGSAGNETTIVRAPIVLVPSYASVSASSPPTTAAAQDAAANLEDLTVRLSVAEEALKTTAQALATLRTASAEAAAVAAATASTLRHMLASLGTRIGVLEAALALRPAFGGGLGGNGRREGTALTAAVGDEEPWLAQTHAVAPSTARGANGAPVVPVIRRGSGTPHQGKAATASDPAVATTRQGPSRRATAEEAVPEAPHNICIGHNPTSSSGEPSLSAPSAPSSPSRGAESVGRGGGPSPPAGSSPSANPTLAVAPTLAAIADVTATAMIAAAQLPQLSAPLTLTMAAAASLAPPVPGASPCPIAFPLSQSLHPFHPLMTGRGSMGKVADGSGSGGGVNVPVGVHGVGGGGGGTNWNGHFLGGVRRASRRSSVTSNSSGSVASGGKGSLWRHAPPGGAWHDWDSSAGWDVGGNGGGRGGASNPCGNSRGGLRWTKPRRPAGVAPDGGCAEEALASGGCALSVGRGNEAHGEGGLPPPPVVVSVTHPSTAEREAAVRPARLSRRRRGRLAPTSTAGTLPGAAGGVSGPPGPAVGPGGVGLPMGAELPSMCGPSELPHDEREDANLLAAFHSALVTSSRAGLVDAGGLAGGGGGGGGLPPAHPPLTRGVGTSGRGLSPPGREGSSGGARSTEGGRRVFRYGGWGGLSSERR